VTAYIKKVKYTLKCTKLNPKMKINLVYFIPVALFATVYCQTCSLTNVFSSAGSFSFEQQSNEGFCRELVVGTVNTLMVIQKKIPLLFIIFFFNFY
jgi:hypothetical protein